LPPKRTLPLYGLGLDVAQALHKSNGPLAIEQLRVGAKYLMAGLAGCCACAASGHAAAPPSSVTVRGELTK
jgi:hypothetical protein